METTQMSINGWMDKQITAYSHNRTLFNHEIAAICKNMDESQKYSKWKNPDTKGQVLYNLYEIWDLYG